MNKLLIVFVAVLIYASELRGQDSVSLAATAEGYVASLSKKAGKVNNDMDKRVKKLLNKVRRSERRLQSLVLQKDSSLAVKLFDGVDEKYEAFAQQFDHSTTGRIAGNYNSYLDTIKTSLAFFKAEHVLNGAKENETLQEAIQQVDILEGKIKNAELLKRFLKERRQYLKEQLGKIGLAGRLRGMSKDVYYYSQRVEEYKNLLKDRKQLEAKAIALLRSNSKFKSFINRHSELAALIGQPGSAGSGGPPDFTGLQTRATVQTQLLGSGINSGNANQFISQQLQIANRQMAGQRNTMSLSSVNENLGELPDFRVNPYRTRPFRKRLEFGMNIQFGKTNNFLPASGEIGVSAGYRLNERSTAGIGFSSRIGLPTSYRHIRFSNQGIGLRSFIDWKIKGEFFLAGGYELNYLASFDSIVIDGIKLDNWQQSGLIGLSKKYSIGKKRKGFAQILFDFLSYQNVPRSQPVIFRTGVTF